MQPPIKSTICKRTTKDKNNKYYGTHLPEGVRAALNITKRTQPVFWEPDEKSEDPEPDSILVFKYGWRNP